MTRNDPRLDHARAISRRDPQEIELSHGTLQHPIFCLAKEIAYYRLVELLCVNNIMLERWALDADNVLRRPMANLLP